MTLCAGLCTYQGRGGLCCIKLSEPLLKFRPRSDLINTLLHEMIHAYLFLTKSIQDHDDHGPSFCEHMDRINGLAKTTIGVYHNFYDEVEHYRQHWWRCEGVCQRVIKRAMNRKPGTYDNWWKEHLESCGGEFTKIKEPPDYKEKSTKRKAGEYSKVTKSKKKKETKQSESLDKWFKSSMKDIENDQLGNKKK
eukprot:TRINITY_DN1668_c0_g1_i1.p1 TRINITY_DN1668_c0_g1~~TRINITY_DN1668_c0_g1_i1.p1  ORF type:complete len:193 (-),score=37.06 TRINITY_DN1668_c0_g1_i1:13-591(-)